MREHWRWLAASLLLASAASASGAAVVRDETVRIDVRADGTVRESVAWTVLVESARDLERWSPYAIGLDENRPLLRLEGRARLPSGKVISVRRKHRDRSGVTGDGVLHSSQEVELVDFSSVPDGSVLELEYEVEERPYFPSGSRSLGGRDTIASLRVEVRANGLRVQLGGAPSTLSLQQGPGTALVLGSVPAASAVVLAPEGQGPVLRYSWGAAADWPAVGAWYRDLVAQVPRGSAAVRSVATRLAAGANRRQAVERLLAFVQREVRYVAVEVGIGGYRPGTPEDVLARRWGDCKDKSLLLVDLLAAAGIDAHVALVYASDSGDIDAAFAAPDQFNHLIVALPAAALATASAASPAPGWLFVDPTQSEGGLEWLHPWLPGHQALVVTPAGGELVAVPLDPSDEIEKLVLELAVDGAGGATGKARLELTGEAAAWLTRLTETERPEIIVAEATARLAEMIPGATLREVVVSTTGDSPPRGRIDAAVVLQDLVGSGGEGEHSLLLPGAPATPAASLLEQRTQPILLSPTTVESEWRIAMPWGGCRLEPADSSAEGAAGSFRQSATLDGGSLVVRRHTEHRAWQVPPERFADLRSLALAEHRTLKRRLRLLCPAS